MNNYSSLDVCRKIRSEYAEERLDAGRGKKCPGGYWIPANKQCGKPGQGGSMKTPGGRNRGRNLAIGAAGLAAAAGAGALAYKNRDKIVSGVDRAGTAVRSAARKAVVKANEAIGSYQPKSEKEKAGQEILMQKVREAGRGVTRATISASKAARSAKAGSEAAVQGVKTTSQRAARRTQRMANVASGRASQAAAGTIGKVKESLSNITKKKEAEG